MGAGRGGSTELRRGVPPHRRRLRRFTEDDLDLGLRANLDATRALLAALRAQVERGGAPARLLVFASSLAVYGTRAGDRALPDVVGDDALATPQTSYGTQKNRLRAPSSPTSRGAGCSTAAARRMMTVAVRAERPNGAASSFFSGLIREPLTGIRVTCPVDPSVASPIASPARTVKGLIAVCEADARRSAGAAGCTYRRSTCASMTCSTGLEAVAGRGCLPARVKLGHDPAIARIVAAGRALRPPVARRRSASRRTHPPKALIRDYIAEREAAGDAAALAGLDG